MIRNKSVTAIIPVYNEEKNLASVVHTVLSASVDEVICVNDGSTDRSQLILNTFREKIKLIHLLQNHGKGYALAQGIIHSSGEIILFIDADLKNFTSNHIHLLLSTLTQSHAQGVLGYGTGSPPKQWASMFKMITGERVYYKKDLLPCLSGLQSVRQGVEPYLNAVFKDRKIIIIPLINVDHSYKHEKYPYSLAFTESIRQLSEIIGSIQKYEGISYESLSFYIDSLPKKDKLLKMKMKLKEYFNPQTDNL